MQALRTIWYGIKLPYLGQPRLPDLRLVLFVNSRSYSVRDVRPNGSSYICSDCEWNIWPRHIGEETRWVQAMVPKDIKSAGHTLSLHTRGIVWTWCLTLLYWSARLSYRWTKSRNELPTIWAHAASYTLNPIQEAGEANTNPLTSTLLPYRNIKKVGRNLPKKTFSLHTRSLSLSCSSLPLACAAPPSDPSLYSAGNHTIPALFITINSRVQALNLAGSRGRCWHLAYLGNVSAIHRDATAYRTWCMRGVIS